MELIESIVDILWRGINYVELWCEQLFSAFGIHLPIFVVSLVFLSAGYRFILGPYLKGTGFSFGDFKAQKTYNGGNYKK